MKMMKIGFNAAPEWFQDDVDPAKLAKTQSCLARKKGKLHGRTSERNEVSIAPDTQPASMHVWTADHRGPLATAAREIRRDRPCLDFTTDAPGAAGAAHSCKPIRYA